MSTEETRSEVHSEPITSRHRSIPIPAILAVVAVAFLIVRWLDTLSKDMNGEWYDSFGSKVTIASQGLFLDEPSGSNVCASMFLSGPGGGLSEEGQEVVSYVRQHFSQSQDDVTRTLLDWFQKDLRSLGPGNRWVRLNEGGHHGAYVPKVRTLRWINKDTLQLDGMASLYLTRHKTTGLEPPPELNGIWECDTCDEIDRLSIASGGRSAASKSTPVRYETHPVDLVDVTPVGEPKVRVVIGRFADQRMLENFAIYYQPGTNRLIMYYLGFCHHITRKSGS